MLPYCDLLLIDLKVLDPQLHEKCTGKSNRRILENLRRLAETGTAIQIRIPIIPGVNDAPETIMEMVRFVRQLRERPIPIELEPFHRLASDKYKSLGLTYQAAGLASLDEEKLAQLLILVQGLT